MGDCERNALQMATQPRAGVRPGHRLSATLKNFWLDIILFIAFTVAWNMHLTGLAIHEWLGILFGSLLVYHLLLHGSWIVGAGKRVVGKLPAMERLKYIVDILLFVNMVVVVATGIWISEVAMGQLGISFETNMLWRQLHTLSADWILWLVALHLALNWRWVTNTANRYLWQPVVRLLSKPAPARTPTKEIVR